ncbi:MAG: MucR family transcriptional regulator [Mesorhizobium sp.]|nr:MucR family transcriptional regulator [Mesorhizobium sp.]
MEENVNELLLELTAEIASAYVSNNPVPASELSGLIATVAASVSQLSTNAPAEAERPVPAVSIKKSVTHDYIISLEDGQKFRSLKRPLMARYGMTPDEYRAKWGLPSDYPMVAPGYAARRSDLAKEMGLGRKPGQKPKRVPKKTAA